MSQVFTIDQPGAEAVQLITHLLTQAGLQVSRSFALQAALTTPTPCSCPHHEDSCDCDLAVLLVYGETEHPATVVVHSHDGRSWLSLVEGADVHLPLELDKQIKTALAKAAVT